MIKIDERAKREVETVAVSEKSAEAGVVAQVAVIQDIAPEVAEIKNSGQGRGKPITDEEVINAVMEKFGVSFRTACDLILAVVENMTVSA